MVPGRDQLLVALRRHPTAADALLGCSVALVQVLLLARGANQGAATPWRDAQPVAVVLMLAQGLPLTWRRRRPVTVLVAVAVPNTLYYALGFPPTGFDFGLGLALYTVAAHRPRKVSVAACLALLASIVALRVAAVGPYWSRASWVLVAYLLFFFSAAWAWGRYQQVRHAYTRELEARAQRAEADRAAETQRVLAQERARIARELHDVVAHHMSVMVIQAGAARRLLDRDPERVRTALRTIEESGRRGLTAMPSLLRALDDDGSNAVPAPQPTLGALDELAADVRAAGLPVTVRVEGSARPLPPGVELSAYRVVQEALTNSLKHAGPARAEVVVRYGADVLEVVASDDGYGEVPTTAPVGGSGRGLIGMRERTALFGGDLRAESGPDGGFVVRARFPTHRQPARR